MANCPKCDYHLRLRDWRPNCPNCGVNLVYYGMEERLLADADKAESEHAHFQKKIDRVKASFVGSKLAIARIVFTVLPIALLFLPWARVSVTGPFIDIQTNISMIKLGMKVAEMDFGALFTLMDSEFVGKGFTFFFASMACMLITAVAALLGLVLLFLSCSPKGIRRNISLASIGLVLSAAATIFFQNYSSIFNTVFAGGFEGSLKFGIFVLMGGFLAVIAINAVIAKVGINVKYKQTFVGGIPSEEYFEALEKGIDIAKLRAEVGQTDASGEEAAVAAVEKALQEAALAEAGVSGGVSLEDIEERANAEKPE